MEPKQSQLKTQRQSDDSLYPVLKAYCLHTHASRWYWVVTQSQACSADDSSPSLKHNGNSRMNTSSKTPLLMVSLADLVGSYNYNAVIFQCENYDTGVL